MQRNKHLHQQIEDDLGDHFYDNFDEGDTDQDREVLFACVREENILQLRRFLDRGLNPNVTNAYQESPLHIAAKLKPSEVSKEILYLLISFGCDVNVHERFGLTPLHVASETSAEHVEMLHDAGSAVNAQDNAGRTALMLGCRTPSNQVLSIMQYLLDRGANVNARDEEGQNALHYACQYTCTQEPEVRNEVIYKLLYAGVDINIEDNNGYTPAYIFFKSTPAMSDFPAPSLLDVRPLICGGAEFLENSRIYEDCFKYKSRFLSATGCVNILSHLTDLCSPLCRLVNIRKVRNFVKGRISLNTTEMAALLEKLNCALYNVRTLKASSRIVVREALGDKIFINANKLNLPRDLVEYIQYTKCI